MDVNDPTGGILADEMGLGKTVEVLGCMLHNPRESVHLPEILPVIQGNGTEILHLGISEFSRVASYQRTKF